MSLRDQLIAAQNNHAPPTQQQQPLVHAPPASSYGAHQSQQSSQQHHHDQVMAIQSYGMPHQGADLAHPHGDAANPNTQGTAPAKKGRNQRELSNTKRAAQNRAAQRAFRLRKEQHINQLQQDIKRYGTAEHNLHIVQQENSALRAYITELQTRMTEKNMSYPPAPEPMPLRSAEMSTDDNQSPPLHDQDQDQTYPNTSDRQPSQHNQHDQQHHYPINSPPQSHAAVVHVYPPPTLTPSHDQHHHRHDPLVHTQHAHHDSANDPLPPGAISQLQAAAAQAGDMDRPHAPSPTHRDHHQQAHPQDAQYNAHGDLSDDFVDINTLDPQLRSSLELELELFGDDSDTFFQIDGILPSGADVIDHQWDPLADWRL
ncbi:hypothetical protein D6D00_02821 [Aureobasidium pullulans]|nr:hypothetical protein D6D00_02821 [Aureobasidium pullulans]